MYQDWQFWIVMSCVVLAAYTIAVRCWRALFASGAEGSCGGCHGCATGSSGTESPLVQLDLSKKL